MRPHARSGKLATLLYVIGSVSGESVTVSNGTIEGGRCESSDVNSFLAIPYALPPVGALRFAAPESYNTTFDGVLRATSPAPNCPQFTTGGELVEGTSSEDCLYMDIWTPANATVASKLPVKVWLFGGSNKGGSISAPLYDGCSLARDSIVVTINYRLGPLGFLAYENAGLMGNYGIQDQLLALTWIQEEIASFGGDPNKVLLFGQSAGAFDAYVISSLPQAPSLFRAVALESSGGHDSPELAWTKPYYSRYIRDLDCSLDDADATLNCLRSKSITAMNETWMAEKSAGPSVLSASTFTQGNGIGNANLAVVDGNIVPENPGTVGARVPAIFGNMANDGSLDVLTHYGGSLVNITEADYDEFLSVSFGPLAETIKETYSWSAFEAASPYPGYTAMTTIITDFSYKCPICVRD